MTRKEPAEVRRRSGSPRRLRGGLAFVLFAVVLFAGFEWNVFGAAGSARFHDVDIASESLVFGRLAMSRQSGVFSHGGLTGFGHGEQTLAYGSDLFFAQQDAYASGGAFRSYEPYKSQIGGQAILAGLLDRTMGGEPIETVRRANTLMALFSSIALALAVMWFFREFGWTAALAVLLGVVASAWLTPFGRSIWWALWAFYVPMLAVMLLIRSDSWKPGQRPLRLAAIVYAALCIKCFFNGYEFITTTLLMMLVPLVYAHIRGGVRKKLLVRDLATVTLASIGAGVTTLAVLFGQIATVADGPRTGWDHIVDALARRTFDAGQQIPGNPEHLRANLWNVLSHYFDASYIDLSARIPFSLGDWANGNLVDLRYWVIVVLFALMSVAAWRTVRSSDGLRHRRTLGLIVSVWVSLLAPLSWHVLFKAHSDGHRHLNALLWQMPFTIFGFGLTGLTIDQVARSRLGPRIGTVATSSLLSACFLCLLALPRGSTALPRITVPDDCESIQNAIARAGNGTTIRVRPGLHAGPLALGTKPLRLVSATGSGPTILAVDGEEPAVTIDPGNPSVLVRGFTIQAANGIVSRRAQVTALDCVFEGQGAAGTAIRSTGSAAVERCRISGFGGIGIDCQGTAKLRFNLVRDNGGGGIRVRGGQARLVGNRVLRNTAERGAGLRIDRATVTLFGNLIASNAAGTGSGVLAIDSTIEFDHDTLAGNRSPAGAGIHMVRSQGTLNGSIVWGAEGRLGTDIRCVESKLLASHSIVRGGWPGTNVLDTDPKFVAPRYHDYSLAADSPARGHGAARAPDAVLKPDLGTLRLLASARARFAGSPSWLDVIVLGAPGDPVLLAVTGATHATPFREPPLGVLHLNLAAILGVHAGTIDASGTLHIRKPTPTVRTSRLYVQALIGARLSNLLVLER